MSQEDFEEQQEFITQEDVQEQYELDEGDVQDVAQEMDMDEDGQDQQEVFEDDSINGFFEHREPVYCVSIHPSEPIAITGGGDDKSYCWRIDDGEKISDLGNHSDSVSAVQFSFDGQFVASGGMDGKIHVFQVPNLVCTLDGPSEWVRWHPRGNVLLAGGEDGTVWMYQIPSGKCMNVFTGHSDSVTCGQFTPDGKMIVTGSADGTVIVWDPKTGSALHKWSFQDGRFHQGPITSLSIHHDSNLMISGAQDGSTMLLHIPTFKLLTSLEPHQDSVESIQFSKLLPYAATSSVDGTIHVTDMNTSRVRFTIRHTEAITKIMWSSKQPHLISSSVDGLLQVWDGRTGELIKVLKGHQNSILDFDEREGVVVTAGDDGVSLVFTLE